MKFELTTENLVIENIWFNIQTPGLIDTKLLEVSDAGSTG